jgi:predicted phosphate transport protein (TIGR00153 family)
VANLGDGAGTVSSHAQAIDEIEKKADKVTHDTVALLHTTFNTPLDRDEIHQLISKLDDILDLIQDVAESMHLYDVRKLTQESCQLADISVSCCERVRTAVSLLSNMDNAPAIIKMCREIDQLESDADRVMRTGIIKLFREETDVRELIKQKGIYELLETVTDRCEDVANIIEGIVLENS